MTEFGLLSVVLFAFFGYYLWPEIDRPDVYYIATGALILTLASSLWPLMRSRAGRLACAVCVLESAQQSICGAARWGFAADGEDLCQAWLGPDLYRSALALALAGVIAWGVRWRRE